jgi:hypothetical protein
VTDLGSNVMRVEDRGARSEKSPASSEKRRRRFQRGESAGNGE